MPAKAATRQFELIGLAVERSCIMTVDICDLALPPAIDRETSCAGWPLLLTTAP